ncbi:MAG TPA: nucleoside triphosphate pyrophosphohydrolase [Flavisolibacter sp.]|jgi:XTP/dITP diphosphohydrolase|nr:nucleoside triphosphate pyrophosphohydrolase [Flavisolibacter sp.]
MKKHSEAFERLVAVMDELRERCPWDRKQTIHTLRQMTLEETYELTEAITEEDWEGIKEELGDLLLHIVFYARIAAEQQRFSLDEVITTLVEKLIYRHPHIYGDVKVQDDEEVKRNWEQLKLAKGKASVLSGLPKALPSVVKAMRLQEKAKQVGFEWDNKEQVWEKVEEEIGEMKEAIAANDPVKIEEEFGDVLFSMVNYARFLNVDADNALALTNAKFIHRFTSMEKKAVERGLVFSELSLTEMDALWNEIKSSRP